jgi:hypothetical protein
MDNVTSAGETSDTTDFQYKLFEQVQQGLITTEYEYTQETFIVSKTPSPEKKKRRLLTPYYTAKSTSTPKTPSPNSHEDEDCDDAEDYDEYGGEDRGAEDYGGEDAEPMRSTCTCRRKLNFDNIVV